MIERAPIVVLGLGNELFTDEGVGVRAAAAIAAMDLEGVDALDGGTLGLALFPEIEGRDGLLVLDAIVAEAAPPGTIIDLGAGELRQPRRLLLSAHQVGVSEVLAAADLAGSAPSRLAAIGMVPFSLETGYGLSDEAQIRLPAMIDAACRVLADWEVEVSVHA